MLFISWLRNWKRSASCVRWQSNQRQRTNFHPRLEALEDRSLPSGLPYPTAANVSQLVADINYADQAGGAYTVDLQPSTTFDLTSELPAIGGTKAVDLTIRGNGDTIERIGSNSFRLLDVASGASLTLEQSTLQGGSISTSGGAIYNQGTVTLVDCTVSGNRAEWGGGIFNSGTLTVNYSTLSNNLADDLSIDGGFGGAIYNDGGTVTISHSALSGNTAFIFAYYMRGGDGGAVYNSGGTVMLDNSTLSSNTAYVGGGIFNDSASTLTVENSSNIDASIGIYSDMATQDVYNAGELYLDSTSTIAVLYGNAAIQLNQNAPQLQIRDVTITEGNTGSVAAQFTVTLSAASTDTITVAYATADGTATAGSDYQAATGVLTFAPGDTSKTVTVLVNGDRLGESNETFFVNLSAATNATIIDARAVGTIMDDEPHISITDVSKLEGKNGQTALFTFTITLSTAYDQSVTMSFRTVDGTARSGQDYVAKTGMLTFAPGETTKTITITVNGDNKKEADETFYLDLFGNSSNSLLTKSRGTGTILNDD